MCRLYALLANEPTKVECSLVSAQNALMKQSSNDCKGRQHADGWGVVCYDDLDRCRIPTTVRHSNAAFCSDKFSRCAEGVYSKAVVAHVRIATVGFASTLNAHPFTHDEWTFAHNGTIPRFETLSANMEASTGDRYLNCRLGTTDSELFFLWLLYQMEASGITCENIEDKQREARKVLVDAVATLANDCRDVAPEQEARLNFVLTNGRMLFACRWNNTMYRAVRDGVYDCEVCGVPHIRHSPSVAHRAVIVASDPIAGEPWSEMPNHSLMYVSPSLSCVVDEIPHNSKAIV